MKIWAVILLVSFVWLISWVASGIVFSHFQDKELIMTPALIASIEEVIKAHEAQKELNEAVEELKTAYRAQGIEWRVE